MSDKARGAIFSALGDVTGLSVLDAFGGSGALAFEAVSRGAKQAFIIEIDRSAAETIRSNAENLNLASQTKVVRANVSSWLENNPTTLFDLVLCDPPYDQLQINTLQKLTRHVVPGGIFILSWPGKQAVPEFNGLELLRKKTYGDIQLAYFRQPT